MPSTLQKAIGAVKDQTSISLAKVASNTNLEVIILKATTHDNVPIDERYIYEVVKLVSSDKFYAKSCAKAIGKRIGRTRNWIVALKSLMLVLRIFQDGDPYFPREVLHAMKRGAKILNLSTFRDESNSRPWDYTAFVRKFALYLDERLDCFLTGKLQRRYTIKQRERGLHRGHRRHNEVIRDMKPPMLLDRLMFWQRLLDRTIATRPTGAATTNRLVLISLYAVVEESFGLYKDISDGLTLLLDSFYHLQFSLCVGAFEACVKASKQYEELEKYYVYCDSIGVGRSSEYPSVRTIPQDLIDTLQEYLKDQSFSPEVQKSSQMLALPAPSILNSSRHGSYGGQSEFSELGSHTTSLEELLNATDETLRARQGISIDLEAYNTDQFDSSAQREETLRTSDAGSTQSLPALNAMADLLCLDDWPEQEPASEPQSNAATSWDLVLAEAIQQPTTTQPEKNTSNTFDAFPEQEQQGQATSSGDNWELVIAETNRQPVQQMYSTNFSLDNLYNQAAALPLEYPTMQQTQTSLQLQPNISYTFDPFSKPKQQEMSSRQGWELVLSDTATIPMQQQLDFTSSTTDNMYNQPATCTYNPFLDEPAELALVPINALHPTTSNTSLGDFDPGFQANDLLSAEPTFQANSTDNLPTLQAEFPTFFTQNSSGNDPFSDIPSPQMYQDSISEQKLMQGQ